MEPRLIQLSEFRLPHYRTARLHLDGSSLSVLDPETFTSASESNALSVPISIATILHQWNPSALAAFLDLDAWFSLTWSLSIRGGQPDASKIEIGRVGNQVTFGSLDAEGEKWSLMLTYNITLDGPARGKWVPNAKESMQGDRDITEVQEIDTLGRAFMRDLVLEKRWETGRNTRHRFFVEYAPMDIWGDGIPMNPHWLYYSLDLTKCTNCYKGSVSLQRCGRCGTATYCSNTCQRRDWAVHKDTCHMSMEDRGQALKITAKGGLIMWDPARTFAEEGSGEETKNPHFKLPRLKRIVPRGGSMGMTEREVESSREKIVAFSIPGGLAGQDRRCSI